MQADIRRLPVNPTTTQRADILQKRQRLHTRMAKFNQRAQLFISDLDVDVTFSHMDDPAFCPEEKGESLDDEEREMEFWGAPVDEGAEEDGPEEGLIEDLTLWMPSYVGASCLKEAGLEDLIKEEVQLRIGQANDSLEKLKTHLGHKSILYRMNFRSSTSVRTDTRSKQDIRRVALKITKDVRSYHRARQSLFRLEASQDILQKYQLIKPDELGVSKDITEENRFGQGSDTLPWFWRIGGSQLGPPDAWNEECKCYNMFNLNSPLKLLYLLEVHRVSWLKARARYERWQEEFQIVKREMVWTTLWFKHQEQVWERRYKTYPIPGLKAYAAKQKDVWERFRKNAEERFGKYMTFSEI